MKILFYSTLFYSNMWTTFGQTRHFFFVSKKYFCMFFKCFIAFSFLFLENNLWVKMQNFQGLHCRPQQDLSCGEPWRRALRHPCPAHLTDVIMFKERQQAHITAALDSFEERGVAAAWVQLHVVIENVGHGSAAEQQADQLLMNMRAFVLHHLHALSSVNLWAFHHLSAVAMSTDERGAGHVHVLFDSKDRRRR